MNEVQIFNNPEFGRMRSVVIDGEPWFVGKDVAVALGYSNPRDALKKHVDNEDKGVANCDTLGGNQKLSVINESGVYALIFSSKLPSARKFKHWVTSEVLPSIRKIGSYAKPDMDVTAIIMQTATAVCTELIRQLTPILQGMAAAQQPVQIHPVAAARSTLETEEIGARCKMETFPKELRQQVDQMFDQMLEQQALNFSMIARYCTMNGFPISQPSVKTYYQRHFESM